MIASLPTRRPFGGAAVSGTRAIAGAAVAVTITDPASKSFGYARYVQAATDPAVVLSPSAKTPLVMTIDPVTSRFTLRAPFDPAHLWDGALFRTQARDDVILLRLNLTVTTMVAGGSIGFEVDTVGGPAALQVTGSLPGEAGQTQVISLASVIVASGAPIASAGARLFLTSTVPVSIGQMILVLIPIDSGA